MYNKIHSTRKKANTKINVPVSQPIPGRENEMALNNAGGYSFKTSDFVRLRRFLMLGVEGNSFYMGQKELVFQNVESIQACLNENPYAVVDMAVECAQKAFKKEPALYVLAMVAGYKSDVAAPDKDSTAEYRKTYNEIVAVRKYALSKLNQVAKIATHLFTFIEYAQSFRGWGPSLSKAVANWYTEMDTNRLALQAWKYKNRNGWSHRDALRLAHPKTKDDVRNAIFKYMTKPDTFEVNYDNNALAQIKAAEELLQTTDVDTAVKLITDYRLTREVVPTTLQKERKVWEALVQDMPMTAMVRTLNRMAVLGMTERFSDGEKRIVSQLTNAEVIKKSRMHPMQILIAANQYSQGRGDLGSLTWVPNQQILDALDEAFYLAFDNVVPTNKNIMVAVDTSGSMGGRVGGSNRTVLMMAGAFALVTLRTEPNAQIVGFDTRVHEDIRWSKKTNLSDMTKILGKHCGGGTDTSAPLGYLLDKKIKVDALAVYTDNETWASGYYTRSGHVSDMFKKYRNGINKDFRMVNCAMVANGSTDVDPKETAMLELCGLGSDTPQIISEFVAGNL